jgi:hypothetical protein
MPFMSKMMEPSLSTLKYTTHTVPYNRRHLSKVSSNVMTVKIAHSCWQEAFLLVHKNMAPTGLVIIVAYILRSRERWICSSR